MLKRVQQCKIRILGQLTWPKINALTCMLAEPLAHVFLYRMLKKYVKTFNGNGMSAVCW